MARLQQLTLVLGLVAALLGLSAPAASAGFRTGFVDATYLSGDSAERQTWLGRSVSVGAGFVVLRASWASIAPGRPAAGAARDPGSLAYRWDQLDGPIRDAVGAGLPVVLGISGAPAWAEGRGRAKNAPPGSWRPDAGALADFLTAAAKRYSGSFPDPSAPGASLPRVRLWQVWNEPNLPTYLTPQWVRKQGRFKPAAPGWYRTMLNAAYGALKAVGRDNVVLTAGTAPFGDPIAGGRRLPPAQFVRDLLCLSSRLRPLKCPHPAHFDVLAHHPYSVRGPRGHALNTDDVSVPDLRKLSRPLAAAVRTRRALPRARKPLWVTEVSWDSSPPDPDGVPARTHARWVADALYVLWQQGVEAVAWFNVVDQAPEPSFAATNQSGVFFRDGTEKPAATAFRFPFVARRVGRRVRVWGRSPGARAVEVQRRDGAEWRTIARPHPGSDGVFSSLTVVVGATDLRARSGQTSSLVWHIGS